MRRLCFVVSSEMTLAAFLLDQIRGLSTRYRVGVVANAPERGLQNRFGGEVDVYSVRIVRKVSPIRDAAALLQLVRLFRRRRFDAIHSVSPKAGLLAMAAGALVRIPIRTHTFTGQVWVTRQGVGRWLLKSADRLLAAFATHILVDSPSQREFLLREGVVTAAKSRVLAEGSISGVDLSRFRPRASDRRRVREQESVADGEVLFLYLGRLTRDKGVVDLAQAFSRLEAEPVRLLFVGPDEERLQGEILAACGAVATRVGFVGYTDRPESYMAAADVFCLPSYREGFGTVVIEAGATGVPAIASRIYGITDSVEDGTTGLLFPAGDVDALETCLLRLATDRDLRRSMGVAARRWVEDRFSQQRVTGAVMDYYASLLDAGDTRGEARL